MSKEFENLIKQAEEDVLQRKNKQLELYQYARSLGFSASMARRLAGTSKDKILRLSKEL